MDALTSLIWGLHVLVPSMPSVLSSAIVLRYRRVDPAAFIKTRRCSVYGVQRNTHTHNSLRPEASSLEGTYTLFDLSIAYILS
jgi:hypothetical protein